VSTTPTTAAGKYQPQLDGLERGQALAERDGDSGPGLGGGRRELVGAEHLRVGHQDGKREHGDDRTDEDAGELGKKLLDGGWHQAGNRSSSR
jgi:hypothetical protein